MTDIRLTLSEELLVLVDKARGDVPRVRWIRRAIEEKIWEHIPGKVEWDETTEPDLGEPGVKIKVQPKAGHEWVGTDKCMRMGCEYSRDRKAHG